MLFFGYLFLKELSFFFPIFPPWIVLVGMDSSFILGLLVIGISIAIFPKYLQSFIDMFKGKEWRVGKTGGIILAEEKSSEESKE